MPIPYRHKRSTAAGVEPTTLQDGEIAINVAASDPKLFFKDSASTIRAFSLASYASATHSHVVADITNFTSVANVVSVNAKTGVVSISHTDVTAASASHTHAASDVTSGTFDAARLPLATTGAAGAVIVGTGLSVLSGTVSVGAIDAGEVLSPPAAPTALSATTGNASLALSWTAPSYEGSTSITGYTIEYTPSGGSASTANTGSASTSYTLTGLTNGTAYTVRVRAVNSIGNGDYSGTAAGTPADAAVTVSVATTGSGTAADPYIVNQNAFTVTANVSGTLYYRASPPCSDCNAALLLNGVQKTHGPDIFGSEAMTVAQTISITAGIFTGQLPRYIYFVPS